MRWSDNDCLSNILSMERKAEAESMIAMAMNHREARTIESRLIAKICMRKEEERQTGRNEKKQMKARRHTKNEEIEEEDEEKR